jgi:hypothetical protein
LTRWPITPDPRGDVVIYTAQAATTGPPWLAIALAAIAGVVALGVALAPAAVERVKRSTRPEAASTPTPPAVESSVDLVREAIDDARREREEAQIEAKRLAAEVAEVRRESAAKDVLLAEQRMRIEHLIDRLGRGVG